MSLRPVPFLQYWVSQGNKWCDFCKIYIANNPQSIRTHELGQRHKDNVANRIAAIRKENASKEKEQKEAMRAMQQIEARAMRSYQKDLASFKETENSKAGASNAHEEIPEMAKPASGDGIFSSFTEKWQDLCDCRILIKTSSYLQMRPMRLELMFAKS